MPNKTPVSIRLDPSIKMASEKVAAMERRSLSNLIEVLLSERCNHHGIRIDGVEKVVRG
jgi:hypothetical protein